MEMECVDVILSFYQCYDQIQTSEAEKQQQGEGDVFILHDSMFVI